MAFALHVLCAVLVSVASAAVAAAPLVAAPADRVVLPGDFVTLVFRVTSDVDATAELALETVPHTDVLGPDPTIELSAGATARVPITVLVPADAPALTLIRVTLTARTDAGEGRATAQLTVGELRRVVISAPNEVSLELPNFPVQVRNDGNVDEDVKLRATAGEATLLDSSLQVPVGGTTAVTVPIKGAGTITLTLSRDGAEDQVLRVRVVPEGVPPPAALTLHGVAKAELTSSLAASTTLTLTGPLSDYLLLDSTLALPKLRSSFASLDGGDWTVRLGQLGSAPFGLRTPSGPGVRGTLDTGPFDVGLAAAWSGADTMAAYALMGDRSADLRWGVAGGIDAGQALGAATIESRGSELEWGVEASLVRGDLNVLGRSRQVDELHNGNVTVTANASHLLQSDGAVSVTAGYADTDLSLYGTVIVPVGTDANWRARTGVSMRLPLQAPGSFYLRLRTAPDDHEVDVAYAAVLDGGWQTSNHAGTRWTARGFGVRGSSSWLYRPTPDQNLGFDTDVTYYPATATFEASMGARFATDLGPLTTGVEADWDLGTGAFGVSGDLAYRTDPFRLELDGSAGLGDDGRFDATVRLRGTYAVDIAVPTWLSDASGGRRVGVLRGTVADGVGTTAVHGIANAQLRIGSATVRTDENGNYEAQLPPGPQKVQLMLVSLPIQYRFDGAVDRTVDIVAKETSIVDFNVTAASCIRGVVLTDTDGDGVADDPPVPATGTVLLATSSGPERRIAVAANGAFEERGLAPGPVTLQLVGLPPGAAVIGTSRLELTLRPGEVASRTFLVRPALSTAPTFPVSSLRIRRIEPEIERVPPGSSPALRVSVQGDATSVVVVVDGQELPMAVQNDAWFARLPVPSDAPAGTFRFEVIARGGGEEASREARLIVDPAAPVFVVATPGATRAGTSVTLTLTVYEAASAVRFDPPFGPPTEARELEPGRWSAEVPVPAGTADAVYEFPATIERSDGTTLEATVRMRVLGP